MGLGTARTLRTLTQHRGAADGADSSGLCFTEPGGPLVVVCGLVGGAGASTLAYLLASQAARESPAPVLLCEPEGPGAGLAVLAGRASRLGLTQLATELHAAGSVPRPFAQLNGGLRLIARPPAPADVTAGEPLRHLLDDARAAHGLVVVDCGGVAHAQAEELIGAASHLLLCLPASPAAVERARLLLATRPGLTRQAPCTALVGVATTPKVTASVRQLRRLARGRYERLVLVPHLHGLSPSHGDASSPQAVDAVGAITTLLRC